MRQGYLGWGEDGKHFSKTSSVRVFGKVNQLLTEVQLGYKKRLKGTKLEGLKHSNDAISQQFSFRLSASGAGGRWFKSNRPDHSLPCLPRHWRGLYQGTVLLPKTQWPKSGLLTSCFTPSEVQEWKV